MWYNGDMKHGWKIFVTHYKSEEHWYIKSLIWGIIGIICFAILIHILKEIGIVPAQKIFDFFNEWATILYAGVTLLLIGVAVWTIMDNRYARRIDRKERLLNEIIEWAEDVATCEYSVSIEKPSSIFTKLYDKDLRAYDIKDKVKVAQGIMQDHKRVLQSRYMNLHLNYQTLDARGEYILSLSDDKDFESIINTIRAVKAQISDYLEILWKYMEDIDDKLQQEKVIEQGKELNKSAIQLIKEAAKIKTRDIS